VNVDAAMKIASVAGEAADFSPSDIFPVINVELSQPSAHTSQGMRAMRDR
jgi:hypothetical protein